MALEPEVRVTLSSDLLRHLAGIAANLQVPIEWVVVGLVCDTVERLAKASRSGE